MKEKEGAHLLGGGLRREIWFHPGGKRMRRTTSATASNDSRLGDSDLEDLTQLTSVEVHIHLNVLIFKINHGVSSSNER